MAEKKAKAKEKEETIFIGKKRPMDYVLAVVTQFNQFNTERVTLKARGRAISTTVDVCEIVKNRFMPDLKVSDIKIGTEEVKRENESTANVSTIEITLSK